MDKDIEYLRKAIELSKKSVEAGMFPAGALVVCNGEIISEAISSKYPAANHHSESDAVDLAMEKLNKRLDDCILYASMESCLMCISRAYWAGIRKIVFAASRKAVGNEAFEGNHDNNVVVSHFNEKMEIIHISELEGEALQVYLDWKKTKGF